VVQVAVMSTVMLGMAALAIDIGAAYTARAELQAAVDSAALAAAARLSGDGVTDPQELARISADQYARLNAVFGTYAGVDMANDIEFGKAVFNGVTGKFDFQPASDAFDAVRVTVRRTAGSEGGALPMMFAHILGYSEKDLWARAAAVLIPRDIAVVIDLSGSMNDDSELQHYRDFGDEGQVNLRDVWCALDGPAPSRPYIPAYEWESEYADDTGPTIGAMSVWGDSLADPDLYDPTADPGLYYLRNGVEWTAPDLEDLLIAQGLQYWERWSILTNETKGYLTREKTDSLGFSNRIIDNENTGTSDEEITLYATSDGSGGTPAMTSLVVSLPSSARSRALATAESQGNYSVQIVSPDPQTGFSGIKFTGLDLGAGGTAETEWFRFRVPKSSYVSSTNVVSVCGSSHAYVNQTFSAVNPGDLGRWRRRIAVAMGLATWKSGMPGGMAGGDDDSLIESDSELSWTPYPSWRTATWSWYTYIDYVRGGTAMTMANSNFRYRYGLKTFVNFLLESRPGYYQTNILWQTPEQPVQAVKDALQAMMDVITSLDSLDHVSLETFATGTSHEIDLTEELQSVPDRLYQMQAGHYNTTTNIGGGLLLGITELTSPRARPAAAKVIVLMSDGKPNINENGDYVGDNAREVLDYCIAKAQQASDLGFRIYTVSVGADVNREIMQEIAALGRGQEFYAAGSPEEYAEQLEVIFRTLGGKRPVALIE